MLEIKFPDIIFEILLYSFDMSLAQICFYKADFELEFSDIFTLYRDVCEESIIVLGDLGKRPKCGSVKVDDIADTSGKFMSEVDINVHLLNLSELSLDKFT